MGTQFFQMIWVFFKPGCICIWINIRGSISVSIHKLFPPIQIRSCLSFSFDCARLGHFKIAIHFAISKRTDVQLWWMGRSQHITIQRCWTLAHYQNSLVFECGEKCLPKYKTGETRFTKRTDTIDVQVKEFRIAIRL